MNAPRAGRVASPAGVRNRASPPNFAETQLIGPRTPARLPPALAGRPLPPSSLLIGLCYRPVYFGGRFSRKEVTPSA